MEAVLPSLDDKKLAEMLQSKQTIVAFLSARSSIQDMKDHELRVYDTTRHDIDKIQIEMQRREEGLPSKSLEDLKMIYTEKSKYLRYLKKTYDAIADTSSQDNLQGLYKEIRYQEDCLAALDVELTLRKK